MNNRRGKLLVIGFGPGSEQHMTIRAKEAFLECDSVIGYNTYIDLIKPLLTEKQQVVRTGMTEEVSRAQEAVRRAETGEAVAVISSGDAGVYGMAGLIYEVLIEKGWSEDEGVEVEIIPGVSAINSCASLLGAPIMHDACTISLSDHLTPWELIKRRVEAAAQADFVIALYNPRSGRRTRQIVETQQILLQHRSPDTPVGLVKSAYREREQVVFTDLKHMLDHEIGMLTTVIIGNQSTFFYDGKIITPRGYQRKYTLSSEEQPLKPHERLKEEAEPWALHHGQTEMMSEVDKTSYTELAEEALQLLQDSDKKESTVVSGLPVFKQEEVFEFAVSPGVVDKTFSAQQLLSIVKVIGNDGTVEYTTNHRLKISVPTNNHQKIIDELAAQSLTLHPIGDVIQVKACDFCNGEKTDAIPYAEEIQQLFGGKLVSKELNIGVNGCGMACYGAVTDDIGIVFRRGRFDLFLGAKKIGRNAHVGQPVVEGIEREELIPTLSKVVEQYKKEALPNERFYKFFKRVGQVQGYPYREMPTQVVVDTVCE